MAGNASITVRLPPELKKAMEERARREHRSLSSQVICELERAVAGDRSPKTDSPGRFLGRLEGARVPSDGDLGEVREMLWGGLADPTAPRIRTGGGPPRKG